MALIIKPKFNIQKRNYYIFITLIFIYIFSYTIYLLSALIINTNIFDGILNPHTRDDKIVRWMTGKIVSYLINAILCIVFLIYISLARFKIKLGFIFIMIWLLLFIAMGVSPHILKGSHDEPIRLATGIISTIAAAFICMTIIYQANLLKIQRKIHRNKLYRIHKQKTVRKDIDASKRT